MVLATKGLAERWSTSLIKVSGWMCSDASAFSFTVIISVLNNLLLLLKPFTTMASNIEYIQVTLRILLLEFYRCHQATIMMWWKLPYQISSACNDIMGVDEIILKESQLESNSIFRN